MKKILLILTSNLIVIALLVLCGYNIVDNQNDMLNDDNLENLAYRKIKGKNTYNDSGDEKKLDENENDSDQPSPLWFWNYKNKYTKDSHEDNNNYDNSAYLGTLGIGDQEEYSKIILGTIHDTGKEYSTKLSDRDADFYSFTIEKDYYVDISLTNIVYNCDYDIKLYEYIDHTWPKPNEHKYIAGSTMASNNDELIFDAKLKANPSDLLDNGKYYIKVYSHKGVSNENYHLEIKLKPYPDDYENNNTFDTATNITNDTYNEKDNYDKYEQNIYATISSNNDVDYYKVNVSKLKVNLRIYMIGIEKECDYDITLYDSNYNYVTSSSNTSNADEYIEENLMRGIYYIKVNSYYGWSSNPYRLSVIGIGYTDIEPNIGNTNETAITWNYDTKLSTVYDMGFKGLSKQSTFRITDPYQRVQYLDSETYLYNFNKDELLIKIGFISGVIETLEKKDNIVEYLNLNDWITYFNFATGVHSLIQVFAKATSPYSFILSCTITGTKIVIDLTNIQYQINVLNDYLDILKNIENESIAGLKIEKYKVLMNNEEVYSFKPLYFTDIANITSMKKCNTHTQYNVYGTLKYHYGQDTHLDYLEKMYDFENVIHKS